MNGTPSLGLPWIAVQLTDSTGLTPRRGAPGGPRSLCYLQLPPAVLSGGEGQVKVK
jgi:hypothetical protein